MRTGGRALVETTFSLDIRPLVRAGAIRDDVHVHADGKMKFGPHDDDALTLTFEVSTRDRANCWMRVHGTIPNRWPGKRRDIDDEISLATVRHPGGGRRWCFVCPAQGWRVRKLYLPAGARHFRSRQAAAVPWVLKFTLAVIRHFSPGMDCAIQVRREAG